MVGGLFVGGAGVGRVVRGLQLRSKYGKGPPRLLSNDPLPSNKTSKEGSQSRPIPELMTLPPVLLLLPLLPLLLLPVLLRARLPFPPFPLLLLLLFFDATEVLVRSKRQPDDPVVVWKPVVKLPTM